MSKKEFRNLFILGLLFYCFAFQGMRGLYEPDEGRYAAIGVRMLDTGDWINPRLHTDKPHYSKPPMTYWVVATAVKFLGKNEFSARIPSTAGFLGTILMLWLMGTVFLKKDSWRAALIYATFIFTVAVCGILTTDGLLTFFETAAVACFAIAYWKVKKERQVSWVLAMWLLFALAFLTKGPPGILPLFSILIFLLLRPQKQEYPFQMHATIGVPIFLSVGFSWYILVVLGQLNLAGFFVWNEFVLRVFSDTHARNPHWYGFFTVYLTGIIFGTLPWSVFMLKGFRDSLQQARESIRGIFTRDNEQSLFLMLYFFVPLFVFAIARSKLPLYILPLFAPMALVAVRRMEQQEFYFYKRRHLILLWIAVMLTIRFVVTQVPRPEDSATYAQKLCSVYSDPVDEIIFVDHRARMGLYFYTGTDISSLVTVDDGIDKELAKHKDQNRLWLIKDKEEVRFEKKLRDNGKEPVHLGSFPWDDSVIRVYKEEPR